MWKVQLYIEEELDDDDADEEEDDDDAAEEALQAPVPQTRQVLHDPFAPIIAPFRKATPWSTQVRRFEWRPSAVRRRISKR